MGSVNCELIIDEGISVECLKCKKVIDMSISKRILKGSVIYYLCILQCNEKSIEVK